MPRQGETFHKLVEHLQRAVEGQPGVTIESPKYLPDKITNNQREHDIVLTYHSPQWDLIVAIECRDRSRKVTVGQIEEFHSKCQDTGISRGIIVSSVGFYETARMKANHYGIGCLMLSQVEKVDWCAQTATVVRNRVLTHVRGNIGFPSTLQDKQFTLYAVHEGGEDIEIDIEKPSRLVDWILPHLPDDGEELSGTVPVEIGNLEEFYFQDNEGGRHPVKRLALEISYVVEEILVPLTFYEFGAEFENPVFEMVITDSAVFGDIQGKLMLIKDDRVGLRLRFVTDQESKPKHSQP